MLVVPFYGVYLVVACFVAHLPGDRPREGYEKATICTEFVDSDSDYSDDLCLCFWQADESVERLCGSLFENMGECLLDDGNTTVPPEPSLQVPPTPLPPPLREADGSRIEKDLSIFVAAVRTPDPTTVVAADTTTTVDTTDHFHRSHAAAAADDDDDDDDVSEVSSLRVQSSC